MKSKIISSVYEYLSVIEKIKGNSELIIFRGQPVEGELLPGIARKNPKLELDEKEMLNELRRIGNSTLPDSNVDDLELLILAQHFGMKTRLLDWTSNPLVALFFACNSSNVGDVYVYTLNTEGLINSNGNDELFEDGKTKVIMPRLNNARIIAQHGYFTFHKYSKRSKKYIPLEKNKDIKGSITEIKIGKECKDNILKSLDLYGINSRVLFPDLEGVCKYINWKLLK